MTFSVIIVKIKGQMEVTLVQHKCEHSVTTLLTKFGQNRSKYVSARADRKCRQKEEIETVVIQDLAALRAGKVINL